MTPKQQAQQIENSTEQGRKSKWPPSGLWITVIVVCLIIITASVTTIWIFMEYRPNPSIQIAIISTLIAIVFGLPGLMFAYFQWFYPKPSHERKLSTTPSLLTSSTVIQSSTDPLPNATEPVDNSLPAISKNTSQ